MKFHQFRIKALTHLVICIFYSFFYVWFCSFTSNCIYLTVYNYSRFRRSPDEHQWIYNNLVKEQNLFKLQIPLRYQWAKVRGNFSWNPSNFHPEIRMSLVVWNTCNRRRVIRPSACTILQDTYWEYSIDKDIISWEFST